MLDIDGVHSHYLLLLGQLLHLNALILLLGDLVDTEWVDHLLLGNLFAGLLKICLLFGLLGWQVIVQIDLLFQELCSKVEFLQFMFLLVSVLDIFLFFMVGVTHILNFVEDLLKGL